MEWGLPVPQEAKSAVDSMGRRKAAGFSPSAAPTIREWNPEGGGRVGALYSLRSGGWGRRGFGWPCRLRRRNWLIGITPLTRGPNNMSDWGGAKDVTKCHKFAGIKNRAPHACPIGDNDLQRFRWIQTPFRGGRSGSSGSFFSCLCNKHIFFVHPSE